MTLTARDIKEYALSLGYARAGITSADDFDDYLKILDSRKEDYDFHLASANRPLEHSRPRLMMPEAKSIVIMALDYARTDFPAEFLGRIGRVYQARAYNPPAGTLHHSRFQLMIDFLARDGMKVNTGLNIPFRWAAAQAGVSTFGRNTFAYVPGTGSFVVLYGMVVDRELETDTPTMNCKCPPDCRACIDACPTGALAEPFKLNPRKCLAFNAWKTMPVTGCGVGCSIPSDIREKMGEHYHGCDVCQEVCPRNHKKVTAKYPADEYLKLLSKEVTLRNILKMPQGFFETRINPIMYNYIKEPKWFQRNVAVAIGNTGNQDYLDDLNEAMMHPEGIVREHVAWAMGKLGGARARNFLEAGLKRESTPQIQKEMKDALMQI